MFDWQDKKVMITGSEGLIGKELVLQLKELGARVMQIDIKLNDLNDLTNNAFCEYVCGQNDYVFHLMGVKGNPKMTKERPVDFMGPMLQCDTNMILSAQKKGVKKFLYTSSIAVENPQTDRFPAHAKKTAEELIHAMRIQYGKIPEEYRTQYCMVRPANVYGRFDNFENPDAMVVTSLIAKAMKEKELIIDITGEKQERDFVNSKDVARGMIETMEKMPFDPVNLCSGEETSIAKVIDIIAEQTGTPVKRVDMKLTLGPKSKIMKPNSWFKPRINIEDGLKEVINEKKMQNV